MVKEIVKKHMDRPTKIVGVSAIVFHLSIGYFLKIMDMYYRTVWKENYGVLRHYLENVHVHGMMMSFFLLFYSFFIEVSDLDENWKRIASRLAIGGAVLMPFTPLGEQAPAFFGAWGGILSHLAVIMVIGASIALALGHINTRYAE